jgi:hypothetical protein
MLFSQSSSFTVDETIVGMTTVGTDRVSTGAAMRSVVAWAGVAAWAGTVGIMGVVTTSAEVATTVVTASIAAVRAVPGCVIAVGVAMAAVITAAAMAEVTVAIRPIHPRSAQRCLGRAPPFLCESLAESRAIRSESPD